MRKIFYLLVLGIPLFVLLPHITKASGYTYPPQYYSPPSYYQPPVYSGVYGGARIITAPYWCGGYYSSVSCTYAQGYYNYSGYGSHAYYSNRYPTYYSSPTMYPGMYDGYPYTYGYY
jgi:hypothetical protein